MNTVTTCILFLLFAGNVFSEAGIYGSLFHLDEGTIEKEFRQLSELEYRLWNNDFLSFDSLHTASFFSTDNDTLKNIFLSYKNKVPLGIPSFWWGFAPGVAGGCMAPFTYGFSCLVGPLGIATIYFFSEEDIPETKKSVIGCVAGTGLGLVGVLALWVAIVGAFIIAI